jgi:8-oxo-dGTP diphosphatase
MNIRLNVAAVIMRDKKILLVEFDDETGLHYNFPGGGVEFGESIYEALHREVLEETNAEVDTIGHMLMIWEYIGTKQAYKYGEGHKVALVFPCTLKEGSEPHFLLNPDLHQTGVSWVDLDALHTVSLIPNIAKRLIPLLQNNTAQPIDVIDDLCR